MAALNSTNACADSSPTEVAAIAAARCNLCHRRIGHRPHYVTPETGELIHVACLESKWWLTLLDAGERDRRSTGTKGGAV